MMISARTWFAAAVGLIILGSVGPAEATKYSLWIHGRWENAGASYKGNHNYWGYWGSSSTAAGVNKKSVNWGGEDASSISTNGAHIRNALDCYCTGTNSCYIAAHSAGDLALGYQLALNGGTTRSKKNATPNSSGVCGNSSGTQVGWNIIWVDVGGGAGGGSDIAYLADWGSSDPLVSNLRPDNARALYDHNNTRSKWFYMFAGAKGTVYSGVLPGQDDEVIAYHSSGAVSGSLEAAFCNPSDWLCNDLNTGTTACEGGATKWSYHTVDFRDDTEMYNHYTGGSWSGIIKPVLADMAVYAVN